MEEQTKYKAHQKPQSLLNPTVLLNKEDGAKLKVVLKIPCHRLRILLQSLAMMTRMLKMEYMGLIRH